MKLTLQTKILSGLMAAIALLLAVAVYSWCTTTQVIEDAEQAEHTQAVMTRLATLLATVTDAAMSARGYVITGNAEFLEPYRQAAARLDEESRALRRLTAGNPRQQRQLEALAPLLAARLANIRAGIELRQARGFAAAQELTASGEGKRIHDAIRTAIAAMMAEEERLLAERKHKTGVTARTALTVFVAGGLGMLLLTGAMLFIINRGFAARERAERERDRLFNLALDMYCIAGFDGYFKQVNPAWHKTLGWSNAELLARPFLEFVHPDDREATAHASATLVDGQEVYSFDNRYLCKDGGYKWLSWVAHPLHEERLIFAAARDITERKQQDEALRLATESAQAADRAKSEFLANMSHELRTPLNAIIGFSELMKEGLAGELTPTQQGYIGDIFHSGEHLLSLINDILDLSKVEAGRMELQPEQVSLPSLLEACLTVVKEKAAAHHIRLSLEIDPEIGEARLDPRKFKQVVYNYLSNAVKFTPDGGWVTLSARLTPAAALPPAARPRVAAERYLEVAVADSGIGIAPQDLQRLFRSFVQLDGGLGRRFEGTGLGLSLVKKLVGLFGGAVGVESQPGKGSRFSAWLPWEM